MKKTINVLYQANKKNEEIVKIIQNTLEKNKIKFEVELKEFVDNTIKELKENPIIQYRMTTKDIKSFIETLKFNGFTEVEAFKALKNINDNIIEKAEEQFEKLVAEGILEKTKNAYVLTSEAKKEFSITKKFSSEEQTIINAIKYGVKKDDIKRTLTLNELLERKNIVKVFKEHYSDEFKIKKFDIRLKKFAEKYDYII